ncbi:MAG: hypothetical protein DRR16_33460 [Candidatus Parabeggiatoa sp. nov. 3]|nr:MAG: hypothetical protein DRR00_05755 [Gammaproteobacteria bacterium]RKZ68031.1 MAG: hypothetical protein DRQ99_04940 [Gammaproteobacteria bacterium]RKZ73017.1 MAG: hypothetical protein DRR16_33460 [Gammaproteobacteria bacterium]
MKKKQPKNPRARNNGAHASLQNYFDRISNSLEDRVGEYLQMKKYIRVYEESKKLLEIEKAINIAAGSLYEINMEKKLDTESLKQLIQSLEAKNKALKSFIQQKKPQSLQLKLLTQILKNINLIILTLKHFYKNIIRMNEVIPVIKALLKKQEKENHQENDPVLIEISNALALSIEEPNLVQIKVMLENEQIAMSQHDAKLHFEKINDVSDKLIGLLNEKLLLIIGVSEFLIAGVDDEGANDVVVEQRLPDELRVLFLASSVFNMIHRLKELRNGMKIIFNSIKMCLRIMNSNKLASQSEAILKLGDNNISDLLSNTTPSVLQRSKKAIVEISPSLDAFDLKLKLDTLELETVIRMTNGLIYEKANRIWENPYDI